MSRQSKILSEAMKAKGWNESELASASGVHQSLISRYLNSKAAIGSKNAPLLAKALGLDTMALLYGKRAA